MNAVILQRLLVSIVSIIVLALVVTEFASARAGAPSVAWQERFGGPRADLANAVATDEAGNAYVVGRFTGSLDGEAEIGGADAFLRVYSPSGEVLLTRQFGSTAFDEATAVTLRGTDVYIVGRTFGATAPGLPSGRRMGFVHRYTIDLQAGTVTRTFAAQLGRDDGQSDLELYSIAVTPDGAMYVAGLTNGAVGGSPTAGDFDAVIARYEANGDFAWAQTLGTSGRDEGRGVAADADGFAYLVGSVSDALPDQTAHGSVDAFVRKYDAAGNVIWTHQFGTAFGDNATGAIVVNGDLYIAGITDGVLGAAATGGSDIYLRKLDDTGSVVWTRQFGTTGGEGNAAVAAGPAGTLAVSAGRRTPDQFFVSLRNADGEAVWERLVDGPLPVIVQFGHHIAVAPNGAIVLCSALDGGRDSSTGVVNWEAFVVALEAPTAQIGKPVAETQSLTTPEDTPIGITLSGSDPQGDPLTFTIATGPAHGALSGTPPALTYTPDADFNGADSFTFTVSDGASTSEPATVTITITPVNDPPMAADDAYSVDEDAVLDIVAPGVLANDSDVDGDPISAVLVSGPAHGTLVLNSDGSFRYAPSPDYNGPDSFRYHVTDGQASSTATVTLVVNPVNDPPTAIDDTAATVMKTPVTISVLANDFDVDGDVLTVTGATAGSNGTTVVNADGTVTYTANPPFTGIDTFTYAISDGQGGSATAQVSVTVSDPIADLQVTVVSSPNPVTVGQVVTHTITVRNAGPDTATGVVLTDDLGYRNTAVSANLLCSKKITGNFLPKAILTCNLGSLAAGTSASVTIWQRIDVGWSTSNTASVTANERDPMPANNRSATRIKVEPVWADLALTLTDSPDPIRVGQTLTYTYTVRNLGPGTAVAPRLDGGFSTQLQWVSIRTSHGSCPVVGRLVSGFREFKCGLGDLSPGSTAVVTVTMRPTQIGAVIAHGWVVQQTSDSLSRDPVPSNDRATTQTQVTR